MLDKTRIAVLAWKQQSLAISTFKIVPIHSDTGLFFPCIMHALHRRVLGWSCDAESINARTQTQAW